MDVNDLKRLFQGAKKSEAHLLLNCWFEQQTSRSHPISPIVESSLPLSCFFGIDALHNEQRSSKSAI